MAEKTVIVTFIVHRDPKACDRPTKLVNNHPDLLSEDRINFFIILWEHNNAKKSLSFCISKCLMHKDLREYILALEERGLLKRVKVEVDPDLEIAEILRRQMYRGGEAVLFERIKGYERWRIVGNIFGGMKFFEVAFDQPLEKIGERLLRLVEVMPSSFLEKLRMIGEIASFSSMLPKTVGKGPVEEVVVENPSFNMIPALRTWPKDAGRYLTFPLVFSVDPKTGVHDIGVYRVQIIDDKRAVMHWQIHKRGSMFLDHYRELGEKEMPVAIVIGADPATTFTGVAPVPYPIDKLLFAGILAGKGIEVIKTENDIMVPARAEVVLLGKVNAGELVPEGPFGDHWGYYTPPDLFPVFHLEKIMMREDPIYHATVVGKPALEDAWLGKAVERMFLPIIRMILPEVVDINLPPHGLFQGMAIVSIKKRFPGHAKKVMMGLWGLDQFSLTRIIIVVDHDVNVNDMNEVIYAISSTVDPQRDVVIIPRTHVDQIDHTTPIPGYGSKMGIDATRKLREEYGGDWPEEVSVDERTKELVDRRWREYGL
jgi:4-hydroxy-3-polyprenylbenzoate decarboxylase